MVQESIFNVGIIGGGPAGCVCAKFLCDNNIAVTIFDKGDILRTLLPTGAGRCNLAHAEFDFKNLAKNYPRGEKFLYSVFSQFGTRDTLNFFRSLGVETYIQEKDNRIFPQSDSSADVREKMLKSLNCKMIKEEVTNISLLKEKAEKKYKVITSKNDYKFDCLVIATGGHSDFDLIKKMGINIIKPEQSLVGLITEENFSQLAGVSLKNIPAKVGKKEFNGDLLFTHKGVSGPLVYEISSVFARKEFPYNITFRFMPEVDLQNILNENPHKEIKNITGKFVPKSLSEFILKKLNINPEIKAHQINSELRNKITGTMKNFEVTVKGKVPDGEVVTCGGVDLTEINPKTLESKSLPDLYFCGEVLDIDGFCGGFNLQNCWSTGYVAAKSIIEKLNHCS